MAGSVMAAAAMAAAAMAVAAMAAAWPMVKREALDSRERRRLPRLCCFGCSGLLQ
jgi:hypothetical protein